MDGLVQFEILVLFLLQNLLCVHDRGCVFMIRIISYDFLRCIQFEYRETCNTSSLNLSERSLIQIVVLECTIIYVNSLFAD